jgi:hypothetical protein
MQLKLEGVRCVLLSYRDFLRAGVDRKLSNICFIPTNIHSVLFRSDSTYIRSNCFKISNLQVVQRANLQEGCCITEW